MLIFNILVYHYIEKSIMIQIFFICQFAEICIFSFFHTKSSKCRLPTDSEIYFQILHQYGKLKKILGYMMLLYYSKKLLKVLSQMNASIESICCRCIDPQDQDLFDDLEKVRAKFKQVCIMFQIMSVL